MDLYQNDENITKQDQARDPIPSELPILALHGTVIYPFTVAPINIEQQRFIKLINDAITTYSGPSKIILLKILALVIAWKLLPFMGIPMMKNYILQQII